MRRDGDAFSAAASHSGRPSVFWRHSLSRMEAASGSYSKKVADLEHGDETLEYGTVTHREGRKVWFERRIVTFTTLDEEVRVLGESR